MTALAKSVNVENNLKLVGKNTYTIDSFTEPVQKREYKAAGSGRLSADWVNTPLTIDQDLVWSLSRARSRARDLAQNNGYAKKVLFLEKINVVGATGFILQVKTNTGDPEFDSQANKTIESAWKEWSKKRYCTMSGKFSFRKVCEMVVETWKRDGEAFIRLHKSGKLNKFGFSLELIESDFIDEMYNEDFTNGNVVRLGVELDKYRRPVAYWIKQRSSADQYAAQPTGTRIRIPAEEIIHLYDPERFDQTRGITDLVQSMGVLKQLESYKEAALINARASASKMGFYTQKDDAAPGMLDNSIDTETGEVSEDSGELTQEFVPGMIEILPKNYGFESWDSKFPSEVHDKFIKSYHRDFANANLMSYVTVTDDLEGVNFSSIRQGVLGEREKFKRDQATVTEDFLEIVYEHFLTMAFLSNAINLPYKNISNYKNIKFLGRRWPWVDPYKDALAIQLLIKMGLKSYSEALGELSGREYEDIQREKGEEKRIREANGIKNDEDLDVLQTPDMTQIDGQNNG